MHSGNCAASVNSVTYNKAQFHLHAPSEHTLNGKALDGEIHFVHTNSDASVGDKSDGWLGPVLDALENVNSTEHSEPVVVNL